MPERWTSQGWLDMPPDDGPTAPHVAAGGLVAAGPNTCRARCTCGWQGPERATNKPAYSDLLDHMEDADACT